MTAGPFLLRAAAWMSVAGALFHLLVIVGGGDWYRFAGAGEAMARAAERGSWTPHLLTLFVAGVIAVWAFYGFAAAAGRRPFLVRTALVAISAVLLLRAALAFVPGAWSPEFSPAFIAVTSAICAVMGFCFAAGTRLQWTKLSKRT